MLQRFVCALLVLALCSAGGNVSQAAEESKSKFDQLIEGKTKISGMWTLYHKDQQLLAEITPADLKRDYIMLTSIARGISQGMVIGGMTWGFGDDVIWKLQKTDKKVFIVRRNVRFRAKPNSPEAAAVSLAYTDSIVRALPILATGSNGRLLIDLGAVFMNDDQQIGSAIGSGFRFMSDRSTWSKVKAFDQNIELQVNAVYSGSRSIETVPDPRGVQVTVHYSLSVLPPIGSNGYRPRIADDRIGYFLTAIKDFSDDEDPDHFVRYINRWNLQKLDPSIDVSPPKEPIRFYLENTLPVYLRPTVEAGILEWNKAFEKIGFAGAIKVDQQPDDEDFDPENIRYNTFRWITADAGFAMGPSRVDPRTGQILDADIIFDAGFLSSWSRRWETFRPEDVAMLVPNWTPFEQQLLEGSPVGHRHSTHCSYCLEMQRQTGFAAAVLMGHGISADGDLPKDLIHQGLKEVVMHEVGHTLGLRHNFKASSWKPLSEINDGDAGREEGIVASVMDYSPVNLAIDPEEQGLYYSQTIGPYDMWAIEYGYKPLSSSSEKDELAKIAARSGEEGLAYLTDEDTRSFDPDPLSNRFDLGSDPLEFVERQLEHTSQLLPEVVDKTVKDGEGYQRARQAFGLLFSEYWRALGFAARYPGGVYMHRAHKGDENGRAPFEVVEPERQRKAMELLMKSAFASPNLDGEKLNYLAASRWNHWGTRDSLRLDYPIHDTVLSMQSMLLSQVLSSIALERVLDSEFKVAEGEDAYTLAEHLSTIVDGIFSEWKKADPDADYTNRDPLIDSFRRNLQRESLRRMALLVTHGSGAPADARTLTRMHLASLRNSAKKLLNAKKFKLDDYTRAHLLDSVARIEQALDVTVTVPSIN